MKRTIVLGLIGLSTLGLAACEKQPEAPKTGSLTHHLKLIGEDERYFGRVELDPIGGGRLFDANNNQVGVITTGAPYVAPAQ